MSKSRSVRAMREERQDLRDRLGYVTSQNNKACALFYAMAIGGPYELIQALKYQSSGNLEEAVTSAVIGGACVLAATGLFFVSIKYHESEKALKSRISELNENIRKISINYSINELLKINLSTP